MPPIDWQLIGEIATTVSAVAVAASAIVVVMQLRQAARERYFSVTAHLFEIWQSPEFQHDQLFLLHKLSARTWDDFHALGRGEPPERAIHRVGGYYDRIGNLVRHGLIQKDDILPTIGGYAVAVWHRVEPLVKEMRLRENALLFENYEWLLPECHECYAPGIENPGVEANSVCAIPEPAVTPAASNGASDAPSALVIGNQGRSIEMATNGVAGANPALAVSLPDTDGISHSLLEFISSGPAVVVYARGAWCPFCLRQPSDYGERYRDFKQEGIEVVALSPESPRKSRRMRTGLKLPFMVLSDSKLLAAKDFGLVDKAGKATPGTVVLDRDGVKMSSLNEGPKCLFASDALNYARTLKQVAQPPTSIPMLKVQTPSPRLLFLRGFANLVAGVFAG